MNIRINTVNTTPIPSLGSLARDYGAKITQSAYAEGDDYISRPHFGLIAEDGPEAIIPLGAKRRQRGIDLWLKAGKHLGVPGYAEGTIAGSTSQSAVGGINVTANPTVQVTVTNGDPDATEAAVVRGLKRSADIIAGEIAAKLGGSFANAMP